MSFDEASSAVLLVCHPGHELRVHGWLEQHRPVVLVLTDGSGSTGAGRMAATERVLEQAGARRGVWFGRFSDAAIYEALLEQRLRFFADLARDLADVLVEMGCRLAVGDAAEGYNSGHDVWRLIIDAAVALARPRLALPLENRAFAVAYASLALRESVRGEAIHRIILDDAALRRKLQAALDYTELRDDVVTLLQRHGAESFREETLVDADAVQLADHAPFYERQGEWQVNAGRYRQVIRYRDHLLPVREALAGLVEREAQCTAYVC